MTPERYARLHALVAEARSLDGAELEVFLDRACANDPTMRVEVQRMLDAAASDPTGDPFAEANVQGARVALEGLVEDADRDWMPEEIGGYRILGRLGQGGMGVVYKARQASPRRDVAIKLLHPMHATPDSLRRFKREAQMLGRLQHPGIAQIFEAGTFDAGRGTQPFFAMELVDGVPLTEYADSRQLELTARLELIAQLCDVIEHAHANGIVHRDLKPANILASDREGTASDGSIDALDEGGSRPAIRTELKVLDFGVARSVDSDLTAATLQTSEGQLIGTVAYMSPEQAAGELDAIDARSDVYTLGVLAYELLTGKRPHGSGAGQIHDVVRAIREQDPPRLGNLDRSLRGDVETIVAKALEKDRERRYGSAEELALDIRRHLRHVPIQARAPSTLYQLGKYVRRNKALVAGVSAVLIVGIAGPWIAIRGERRAGPAVERLKALEQTTEEQLAELQRLADAVLVTDLARQADELWPMQPETSPLYDDWLTRAATVLGRRPQHEDSVSRARQEVHLNQVIAG